MNQVTTLLPKSALVGTGLLLLAIVAQFAANGTAYADTPACNATGTRDGAVAIVKWRGSTTLMTDAGTA